MKFQYTAEALRRYDASKEARAKLWAEAETTEDVNAAQQADADAVRLVQAGFFYDTMHINCWDNVQLIHPEDPWLQKLVTKSR